MIGTRNSVDYQAKPEMNPLNKLTLFLTCLDTMLYNQNSLFRSICVNHMLEKLTTLLTIQIGWCSVI